MAHHQIHQHAQAAQAERRGKVRMLAQDIQPAILHDAELAVKKRHGNHLAAERGNHAQPAYRRDHRGEHRDNAVQRAATLFIFEHGRKGKRQAVGRRHADDAVLVVIILQIMVPVEGSRKHVPGRKNQPQTIDPVRVVLPAVEADAYQAKGQRGSIALYQRMTPLVGQQAQKHRQRKKHGRQPARVPQAALCARAQRFLTHALSLPVVSRCTCRSVHGQRFCLRGHTPHSG